MSGTFAELERQRVSAWQDGGSRDHGPGEMPALQRRLNERSQVVELGRLQERLNDRLNDRPMRQRKANLTGLPDGLKSGVEALSGMSLDAVRVYRNSSEPAKVGALATAQGTEIHLGPGQEQHLPHEAWHTVQQAQGRVRPTVQMKGVAVNDEAGLEREADVMGARALARSYPGPHVRMQTRAGMPVQLVSVPGIAGLAAAGGAALGAIGYLGVKAYQHFVMPNPERQNVQAAAYAHELARFTAEQAQTAHHPAFGQAFREEAAVNLPGFRQRIESGVPFIWTLPVQGSLAIANGSTAQHSISAGNVDVIAAGGGRLKRAAEQPDLTAADRAAALRERALDFQAKLQAKQNARAQGQPDPFPGATEEELEMAAQAEADEAVEVLRDVVLPQEAVRRSAADDIVQLDLQSGHYRPETSGRILTSRAWAPTYAAWGAIGFRVEKLPGSQWL